jgi:hypothetical protein
MHVLLTTRLTPANTSTPLSITATPPPEIFIAVFPVMTLPPATTTVLWLIANTPPGTPYPIFAARVLSSTCSHAFWAVIAAAALLLLTAELCNTTWVLPTTHSTASKSAFALGTPMMVLLLMLTVVLPQNLIQHAGLTHSASNVTPWELWFRALSS